MHTCTIQTNTFHASTSTKREREIEETTAPVTHAMYRMHSLTEYILYITQVCSTCIRRTIRKPPATCTRRHAEFCEHVHAQSTAAFYARAHAFARKHPQNRPTNNHRQSPTTKRARISLFYSIQIELSVIWSLHVRNALPLREGVGGEGGLLHFTTNTGSYSCAAMLNC